MFHEAALEQNMKVLWRRAESESLLIPNQKTSPREKVGDVEISFLQKKI